jgi:hypothetical protein
LGNDPINVQHILRSKGFSALDAENVAFLVKLHRLADSGHLNAASLSDIMSKPINLGKNMIKHFLYLIKAPDHIAKSLDKNMAM